MGLIRKALSPVSSYSAKKTSLWPDLLDRIEACLFPSALDELAAWIDFNELAIPGAWRPVLLELIEKRRDELASEDISQILREKFDFT